MQVGMYVFAGCGRTHPRSVWVTVGSRDLCQDPGGRQKLLCDVLSVVKRRSTILLCRCCLFFNVQSCSYACGIYVFMLMVCWLGMENQARVRIDPFAHSLVNIP